MNYIAAMLLLALGRGEEDAFWMMASLIDDDNGEAAGCGAGYRRLLLSPRALVVVCVCALSVCLTQRDDALPLHSLPAGQACCMRTCTRAT